MPLVIFLNASMHEVRTVSPHYSFNNAYAWLFLSGPMFPRAKDIFLFFLFEFCYSKLTVHHEDTLGLYIPIPLPPPVETSEGNQLKQC